MTAATRRRGSTRERLLDVALELFGEEGFGGTTITEVERRAGLTPGTGSFYRHFPSKEELLRAAVGREVERCMAETAAARKASSPVDDPVEEELRTLRLLLDDIRRFGRLSRLLVTEGERVPEVGDAVTSALERSGRLSWRENPDLVLRAAALMGYLQLTETQGPTVDDLSEHGFLLALAELRVRRGR